MQDLKTARALGRDVESMRKYHGDAFCVYELAAPRIHGRVLDIACGTGVGTKFLAQHAQEIVGVDIDQKAISHCVQQHKRPNLSFLQADATNPLPFPDKHFDTITTFETIEHLYPEERKRYLAQLLRVLKDTGIILLSTPQNGIDNSLRPIPPPEHIYDHKIEFCFAELKQELHDAGFVIAKAGGVLYALHKPITASNLPPPSGWYRVSTEIRKLIPERIKEQVGHRIAGYPHHIKHYSYSEADLAQATNFYLELKKK